MSKCLLLDCTLRDGGYINNWEFGDKAIYDICSKLEDAGVDILELGFLRDETYSPNRVVWNDIQLADKYISKKDSNRLYAVMGEIFNPFPLEKLKPKSETSIDIIRIIVWKRLIPEALN